MRLKNILITILAAISLMTFTGCIDIIEEMTLRKNGTGNYTMRMDMSGMMGMMQMMSEFGGEMEGGEENGTPEDLFKNLMANEEAFDSTVYLKNADPELLAQFSDNPGFAEKVNIHIKADPTENEFLLDFNVDFRNMDDLDYFFKNFDKIASMMGEGDESSELDMMSMGGASPLSGIMSGGLTRYFDLKKRTLIRRDATPQEASDELKNMSGEERQMMEMMFGDASYKVIYNLPGKVKKMTSKDATLSSDKKTVMLQGDLMDYMTGDFKVANIIQFGRK